MLEGYKTVTMGKNSLLREVEERAAELNGGTWEVLPDAWAVWRHPKITFCFTWIVKRVSE